MEAMRVIGFSPEEVGSVHRILAAILHLVSLAEGGGASTPRGAQGPPLEKDAGSEGLGPQLWALRAPQQAGQACTVTRLWLGQQGSAVRSVWLQAVPQCVGASVSPPQPQAA